jgi:hypothetical protein
MEIQQHAGWFLVVENRWLDRLKILSWHPVLATGKDMRSVCGRQHLKVLITHWLTVGSLELQANASLVVPITSESQTEADLGPLSVGRLVGELSVHREALSRVWTGSRETLECILRALIGPAEPRTPASFSVFDLSSDRYCEPALH